MTTIIAPVTTAIRLIAISTPPMNLKTIDGLETPPTTTDGKTFYSEDEPRPIHWTSPLDKTFQSESEPRRTYLLSSPSPPSPPQNMKRKLEMGISSFSKKRGVSQHVFEASGQTIASIKYIPGLSTND